MAGFQPTLYGRFWVTPEEQPGQYYIERQLALHLLQSSGRTILHLRQFIEEARYFGAISLVYGDISEKRRELFAGEFETIFRGLNEKQ